MRLIDADALAVIDGKVLFMGRNAGKMRAMTVDLVKQLVATAPTIDAVEVRHGEWEMRGGLFRCSTCDGKALLQDVGGTGGFSHEYEQVKSEFCPHCFAKMDGKGEGE